MNNQRRHQLEQNYLANYLGIRLSRVQHLLKPALIAVAASFLGFLGYTAFQSLSTKQAAEAWTKFYFNLNGDAESFEALANQYGAAPAGQWARFSAAAANLQNGIEALYVNRQEGVGLIQKAIAELGALKNSTTGDLRTQSILMLAKAHESLGELDQAISHYQSVVDATNLSELEREQVRDRVSFLLTQEAKEFYQWFGTLNPKPAASPEIPGDLGSPPESPTIQFDPDKLPAIPADGAQPTEPSAAVDGQLQLELPAETQPASDETTAEQAADTQQPAPPAVPSEQPIPASEASPPLLN
ncbi:MAG: hypothetical protein KF752_18070 [Pirellulaceae bacterium]|nr:hypothetical protein [Pirellulaceae bacterium]